MGIPNRGYLTNRVSVNDRTYTSSYDVASRVYHSASPEGREVTVVYDEKRRPVEVAAPGFFPTEVIYGEDGRILEIKQGDGAEARITTLGYDAGGFLASISNALGHEVVLLNDVIGQVTNIIQPDLERIGLRYDASSFLTGIAPPDRSEHTFEYNSVGLVDRYSPPDVGGDQTDTVYTRNALRELTGIAFPDGRSISNTFSPDGLLIRTEWPENQVDITYDSASRRPLEITSTNQNGLALAWDGPLIKQIQAMGGINGTVNLAYNNSFLVSSIAMNSDAIAYGYDLDGLMVQAGALAFLRDGGVGFVTNSTLGLVQDHRVFNGFGDFVSYQADFDGEELYGVDFQHDALGRITSRVERIMGETNHFAYGYDVVGRLIRVETNGTLRAVYQVDANGNRTNAVIDGVSASGVADDQDRLLSYGSAVYQYNDHGTLTNKVEGANTTAYVYDTRGSLLEVRSGTNAISYSVDALGRRIARTHNGETTQRFVYQDFLKPIAELDGDGSVVSRFVYATRVNVPDYIVKGEDVYRVITDHLGSVRLVVHADTGAIAQRLDYDEWGNVLLDTAPGFQPFGFAGGLYDADTGLVRFGYRDYDARVGRWLAKDPILFAGGQVNIYVYCIGDPMNRIDPTGLYWKGIIAGIGGIAAVAGVAIGSPALVVGGGVVGIVFLLWELNDVPKTIDNVEKKIKDGPIGEYIRNLEELL